jgi:hypothetical protein
VYIFTCSRNLSIISWNVRYNVHFCVFSSFSYLKLVLIIKMNASVGITLLELSDILFVGLSHCNRLIQFVQFIPVVVQCVLRTFGTVYTCCQMFIPWSWYILNHFYSQRTRGLVLCDYVVFFRLTVRPLVPNVRRTHWTTTGINWTNCISRLQWDKPTNSISESSSSVRKDMILVHSFGISIWQLYWYKYSAFFEIRE